jgi:hypothetical protein
LFLFFSLEGLLGFIQPKVSVLISRVHSIYLFPSLATRWKTVSQSLIVNLLEKIKNEILEYIYIYTYHILSFFFCSLPSSVYWTDRTLGFHLITETPMLMDFHSSTCLSFFCASILIVSLFVLSYLSHPHTLFHCISSHTHAEILWNKFLILFIRMKKIFQLLNCYFFVNPRYQY